MTVHTADATDEVVVPEPRETGVPFWRRRTLVESVTVVVLAQVLFFLGLGGGLDRLRAPLGRGDMLFSYAIGFLFSRGAPFGNNDLGYPFGLELRYFPTTDHLPNAVAGLVSALTGDPFLGLNVVYALSFPATALAALWMLRIAGLRGPMGVLLSLALTFIPFHWLRIEHVYLATMYSAVLGVCLALLIGTGEVERRLTSPHRVRHAIGLGAVALLIATGGVYYACFAVLLAGVALVWRFAHGARWRGLLIDVAPVVATVVLLGLALLPSVLYVRANPPTYPVAGRLPVESVLYSGSLALALLPAPLSKIPGFGVVNDFVTRAYQDGAAAETSGVKWFADSGSFFTVMALAFTLAGVVWVARRRAQGRSVVSAPGDVTFGLVGALTLVVIGFFVPWGLNYLFAFGVTGQLRAWDRLIPVLYALFFVGAAVAWRQFGLPQRGWRTWVVAAVCGVLLLFDGVAPYRAPWGEAVAGGSAELKAAEDYATAVNDAVPGRCGVLQLPLMRFPEEAPINGLNNYDHFLAALVNSEKEWSHGSMKDTRESTWQDSLSEGFDVSMLDELAEGGFCGIHVDKRGYTATEYSALSRELRDALGAPVATGHGGDWSFYAIPAPATTDGDAEPDLDSLSEDAQLFYAPPVVRASADPLQRAERDGESTYWWTAPGEAAFTLTASAPEVGFGGVTAMLRAADCAPRTVEVTLAGEGQTVTRTVELGAGEEAPVELDLGTPVQDATLTLSSDGEGCTPSGDPRSLAVALADLTPTP